MKAVLKNYNQSPRKVRLVADAVRGRDLREALTILDFMPKRAAGGVKKVIASAAANARENGGIEENLLRVASISVDEGFTLKRYMPRAFGRATPIRKRTSIITVVLAEKEMKEKAGGKTAGKSEKKDKEIGNAAAEKAAEKKEEKEEK